MRMLRLQPRTSMREGTGLGTGIYADQKYVPSKIYSAKMSENELKELVLGELRVKNELKLKKLRKKILAKFEVIRPNDDKEVLEVAFACRLTRFLTSLLDQ